MRTPEEYRRARARAPARSRLVANATVGFSELVLQYCCQRQQSPCQLSVLAYASTTHQSLLAPSRPVRRSYAATEHHLVGSSEYRVQAARHHLHT